MKRLVASSIFIALTLKAATALGAAEASKPTPRKSGGAPSAEKLIVQAKELMSDGKRRAAIAALDQASAASPSRKTGREIEAKKTLFAEQFFTSDSFQRFQEAKAVAGVERWEDCLRELSAAGEADQDNILILKLRADCQSGAKLYDDAAKTYRQILGISPGDIRSTFALVEIALIQKQTAQGLTILESVTPRNSSDNETYVVLKSRLLVQAGKNDEAINLLREDQEKNLDHIHVLYELGSLYADIGSHDWAARRLLLQFVSRCKRLKESELKGQGLDKLLAQAQTRLAAIEKRLGVQP